MFIWDGFLIASGRTKRGLRDLESECPIVFLEEETGSEMRVISHVCPVGSWGNASCNQGSPYDLSLWIWGQMWPGSPNPS